MKLQKLGGYAAIASVCFFVIQLICHQAFFRENPETISALFSLVSRGGIEPPTY